MRPFVCGQVFVSTIASQQRKNTVADSLRRVPDNFRGRKFPTSDLKALRMQDAKSGQKPWLNVTELHLFDLPAPWVL